MSEIAKYYSGKKVLITGATGFVGKVVIEKLLRVCPDISEIYLFLRSKRDKTSEERLEKIFSNSLFSVLKEQNPNQLKKARMVEAELKRTTLNLKPEDELMLIENCQLVFHVAASVQFDKGLHDICDTNVYGLKQMLNLAKKFKKLEAFVFCSTTFCQYKEIILEEKGYDPPIAFENLDKILTNFCDDTLRPLERKMLGLHENTYAFSKAIAESVVHEYSQYFPIVIGRPSIVCNITHDPLPGWVDGLNGFNGFVVVAGFGLLKVVRGNPDYPRTVVPADIVSNGLIVIGWQTAIKRPQSVEFYNLAEDYESAKENTYRAIDRRGYIANSRYPFEIQVAPFGYHVIDNEFLAWLATLWYHLLYGIFLDTLLVLFGREPMVLRVLRKVEYNMDVIKYYIKNPFVFLTPKFIKLRNVLNQIDRKLFPLGIEESLTDENWFSGYLGFRTYVLKQDPKTIPRSKRLAKVIFWISTTFKLSLAYFIIKFFYNHYFKDLFQVL